MIHRDIKAMNILVDDAWCYKIADLGISRLKAQEEDGRTGAMTQVGACLGGAGRRGGGAGCAPAQQGGDAVDTLEYTTHRRSVLLDFATRTKENQTHTKASSSRIRVSRVASLS